MPSIDSSPKAASPAPARCSAEELEAAVSALEALLAQAEALPFRLHAPDFRARMAHLEQEIPRRDMPQGLEDLRRERERSRPNVPPYPFGPDPFSQRLIGPGSIPAPHLGSAAIDDWIGIEPRPILAPLSREWSSDDVSMIERIREALERDAFERDAFERDPARLEEFRDERRAQAKAECESWSAKIAAALAAFAPESPGADPRALGSLAMGIPIASFRSPRLASFGSGLYTLWDAGIILGVLSACRLGLDLLRSAAAPSAAPSGQSPSGLSAALGPDLNIANAARKPSAGPVSRLAAALGAPASFPGLSHFSRADRPSLGLAFEAFLICRRGLAEDPEGFFAQALALDPSLRFPLADPALSWLADSAQSRLRWEFLSESAKTLPETLAESALAFARSCEASVREAPSPAFGDIPLRLRALEISASLAGLPALPSAPFWEPRSRMALIACESGDADAAKALASLGARLSDPLQGTPRQISEPTRHPMTLRDRLLDSGFVSEAAFALSGAPERIWPDAAGADALAVSAVRLARVGASLQPQARSAALALLDSEPIPGACASILLALAAAYPDSPALQSLAEEIAMASSLQSGSGSPPRPRAL